MVAEKLTLLSRSNVSCCTIWFVACSKVWFWQGSIYSCGFVLIVNAGFWLHGLKLILFVPITAPSSFINWWIYVFLIARLPLLHGLKLILFVAVTLLQFLWFLCCLIYFDCSNVFGNTRTLERDTLFLMVRISVGKPHTILFNCSIQPSSSLQNHMIWLSLYPTCTWLGYVLVKYLKGGIFVGVYLSESNCMPHLVFELQVPKITIKDSNKSIKRGVINEAPLCHVCHLFW